MSSADNEDDPSFSALSTRLRRRIDGAFDSVVSQWQRTAEDEPGGFIVEDVHPKSNGAQSHIPLSDIHRALNLLDLSPDEDVMGVFKNAATGWGAQGGANDGVSKKDWRAVCAALLEGENDDGSEEEDRYVEIGDDSGPESDEYRLEEVSTDTEGDSSDEYEEPGTPRPDKSTRTMGQRELTESQRAQCRQDFARFFPHVPDNELDRQQIMVKDISRVADLLKESLKAEEILEMLEVFSTSPDKSMNLADFERMMVLTKLV